MHISYQCNFDETTGDHAEIPNLEQFSNKNIKWFHYKILCENIKNLLLFPVWSFPKRNLY